MIFGRELKKLVDAKLSYRRKTSPFLLSEDAVPLCAGYIYSNLTQARDIWRDGATI